MTRLILPISCRPTETSDRLLWILPLPMARRSFGIWSADLRRCRGEFQGWHDEEIWTGLQRAFVDAANPALVYCSMYPHTGNPARKGSISPGMTQ